MRYLTFTLGALAFANAHIRYKPFSIAHLTTKVRPASLKRQSTNPFRTVSAHSVQHNEDFPTNQPTHRPLVSMSIPALTGHVALSINPNPFSTNTVIARPTKLVRLKFSKTRSTTINQILLLPPKRALSPPPYHPHQQMLKRPLPRNEEQGLSALFDKALSGHECGPQLRKMRRLEDDSARERTETVAQRRVGEMLRSKIEDLEAGLRWKREESVEQAKGMGKLRSRVQDLGYELQKEREKNVERAKVVTEQVKEMGELRSMIKDMDCELQKERGLKRTAVQELLECRTAKEKLEMLKQAMAAVME